MRNYLYKDNSARIYMLFKFYRTAIKEMIVLGRKKFFLQYRKVEKLYCNSLFKGFGYINEAFVYVSKGFVYISEGFG